MSNCSSALEEEGRWGGRGRTESPLSRLVGQQSSSDLCRFNVDMSLPMNSESAFAYAAAPTRALVCRSSVFQAVPSERTSPERTWLKVKCVCTQCQRTQAGTLVRWTCSQSISADPYPPLSLIKSRCANTKVYLSLINDNR